MMKGLGNGGESYKKQYRLRQIKSWLLKPDTTRIGHFTVVCLVAKPLIWSEAEGDLVVIETSI